MSLLRSFSIRPPQYVKEHSSLRITQFAISNQLSTLNFGNRNLTPCF